jgi:hypothetical protein
MSLRQIQVKKPSIERLNVTLKLYDPNWQGRMLGTQSPERVAPNTYRPTFYKRPSPGKFGTEKTKRLNRVVDFGPSPHKYDIMTGLSMCSSTEKMATAKVGDK